MPPKIIVREATREQTFELNQPATVLGREPSCDIQLLDWKLSRRHARLELTPQGVKVVDLGSTNGTFVNGQPVTETWLQPGDEIQIGNIKISFLIEEPREMATQALPSFVSGGGVAQEPRTVTASPTPQPSPAQESVPVPPAVAPAPPHHPAVEPAAVPPTPPPPAPPATPSVAPPPPEQTVFLDAQKLRDLSQAPPAHQTPLPPPVENTAKLPSFTEAPATSFFDAQLMQQMSQPPGAPSPRVERGTQVLDMHSAGGGSGRTTMLVGPAQTAAAPTIGQPSDRALLSPMIEQVQQRVVSKIRFPHMPWRTKFVLMLSFTLVFLLLVITLPLLSIQEKTTAHTSLSRGQALTTALAARNYNAVVNNLQLQLDADFIKREPGVKDALVLNAEGRVLAPVTRSGEIITQIEGLSKPPSQIKIREEGVTALGDYNMVAPIKNDNAQVVGLAWITYTPAGLADSASSLAVVLMLVIFLSIIGGSVLVWGATNMTVKPLAALKEATESVIRGDVQSVDHLAGFAEANALAHSINRLVERAGITSPLSTALPGTAAPTMGLTPFQAPVHPGGSPSLQPALASATPGAGTDSGDLVIDGNFAIMDVQGSASKWLGARPEELLGKHVIEAVREQLLLEVILDLINALGTQPQATQEADFSTLPSLGAPFVFWASKAPGTDQTHIHFEKK